MDIMNDTNSFLGEFGVQVFLDYSHRDLTHVNLNVYATRIDLRYNRLIGFHDWPSKFQKLTHLWLDHNQIASLLDFPYMPNLEYLSLGHNQLQGNITADLRHLEKMCPNLFTLNLNFNDIAELYIPNVPILTARSNKLTTLSGDLLANRVSICHLGDNHLRSLKGIPYISTIGRFRATNNPITTLRNLPAEIAISIIGVVTPIEINSWALNEEEGRFLIHHFVNLDQAETWELLLQFYKKIPTTE
jgi:Leucine-rich repeat (LRR) protein